MTKERKALFFIVGALLLCVLFAQILYSLFGHQLIESMFKGKSIGALNNLISKQATHPVEDYFSAGDRLFSIWSYSMIMAILAGFVFSMKSKNVFYTLLTCYAAYCIIFIIKASFINEGVRYFTLFDDAMISMTYAKNFAAGHGLIWNPGGPRIEGYTNFLWTIYMSVWHLFPISPAKTALPIQISGLFFLICSLFLVRKIADDISNGRKYVSMGAVLLTASYLPVNFWGLRGMETSVLGFILLLIARRFLKGLEEDRPDHFIFILLGIGVLIRADFVFLFVSIASFIIIAKPERRKDNLLLAAFVFIVFYGGHTLFRLLYYGYCLPNTYYLKMTGVSTALRAQCGLLMAVKFIRAMSPVIFALPFIVVLLNRKNKRILFLIYVFLVQFLYSIYVGGDAWERWGHFANRYLCIVMPIFFILTALAIYNFFNALKLRNIKSPYLKSPAGSFCFIGMLSIVIFQVHGGFANYRIIDKSLFSFSGIHVEDDKKMTRIGLKLRDITTPGAKIAVVWAGSIPYFSDRFSIDLLGKSDDFISHLPARVKTCKEFHPGHNKYDYAYSIGKLRPDVVLRLWQHPEEAGPWLDKYYEIATFDETSMYFRKDSPDIIWDKLPDNAFSRTKVKERL